jgi:peroxiredoxin
LLAVAAVVVFALKSAVAQAQPSNDDFASRNTMTGSSISVSGSNVNATKESGEPNFPDNLGGKSVWWTWTAPTDGMVTLTTTGSSFDTLLAVYTGDSVQSLSLVGANDDDPARTDFTSRVQFDVAAGMTCQIVVDGFNDDFGFIDSGSIVLNLTLGPVVPRPANDNFANRIAITDIANPTAGSNVQATKESAEPDHAGETGGRSVWWTWTAPATGLYTVSTVGSSFDTVLAIYRGSSLANLSEVSSDDDSGGGRASRAAFLATAGTSYQIAVDGYEGASGAVQLTIVAGAPTAPYWELKDLDGNTVKSTDFAGRVILFNFWATWCVPCVVEIPDLISLHNQYEADGLTVIGPSVDTVSAAVVKQFTIDHGMNYPVVMAQGTTESAFGGIAFIPTTFVIDREGRIVGRFVGTQTRSTFENAVLPLLNDVRPSIQRSAGSLTVSWPAAQSGYVLESADTLSPPTGPKSPVRSTRRTAF